MELRQHTLETMARKAYERARFRRAVLGALPLLLLIGPAAVFTTRPATTIGVGGLMLLGAVALLWFGRGLPRAALAGVAAGVLPLGLVLCSARVGHVCAGAWCMQFCFATSALGGLGAGALIGRWALSQSLSASLLGTACGFSLMTAALGSTCAGPTAFVALVVGFALGLGAQWVRRQLA